MSFKPSGRGIRRLLRTKLGNARPIKSQIRYGLFLLVCALFFHASERISPPGRSSLAGTESPAATAAVSDLKLAQPITREPSSAGGDQYQVAASAGQYLRVALVRSGPELTITVIAPDGQRIKERASRRYGRSSISLIATVSGLHKIEVRPTALRTQPGNYSIVLEQLRAASPGDTQYVAGEDAFLTAERLALQGGFQALNTAIDNYSEALSQWRGARASSEECQALQCLAQAYYLIGEYQKAVDCYTRVLQFRREIRGTEEEADALNNLSSALVGLGKNQDALQRSNSALALFRTLHSRRGQAEALDNIGEVYYAFSKLNKALESYNQALEIWKELRDAKGEAETLMNLGVAYSLLRDSDKSINYLLQALAAWRLVGNERGEALTLTVLGTEYTSSGEWQKAREQYDRALKFFEATNDRYGKARTYNCLAYLYIEGGQKEKARDLYNQALPLFLAIGRREAEAGTRINLGDVHFELGENEEALQCFVQALGISRELSDRLMESYALAHIGRVYEAMAQPAKALEHYNHALVLHREGGDRKREAETLNNIGRVLGDLGDKQKALACFNQALHLNEDINNPRGMSASLYYLARARRDLGKLVEARTDIETALRISETLRTKAASQDLRVSYFATARELHELCIDILMRLDQAQPGGGFNTLAFNISERARARSLLDALKESRTDIRRGVDPKLLEREHSVQETLNAKAEHQMQLLAEKNKEEAQVVGREIEQLTIRYDAVMAEIRATSPRYAALTQPQPLTLKEIQQQLLDDNAVLLEYALGEERSYLWLVTRNDVSSFALPPRSKLEDDARHFYDLLTANQPLPGETFDQRELRVSQAKAHLPAQSEALGASLLGPVAGQLGNKRVLVVADGALQYIPFQALTLRRMRDGLMQETPLVVTNEVINEPSASALALVLNETSQRGKAPNSVAVFADPVFAATDPRVKPLTGSTSLVVNTTDDEVKNAVRDVGLSEDGVQIPRLLASREEADGIMTVIPRGARLRALGFDASRAAVMRPDLNQYRILHFATHGLLNNEHPELSGIVLSLFDREGHPQEGFLRLHDIYNLNLPVDLVVLSACNTAIGKDVRGEGLIGLTRGFMYAGAGGVVASLWKVDDDATAALMKHFYEGMFAKGLSPAAALREAQLAIRNEKRWQSPYYWAGFIIQGQYNQKTSIDVGSRAYLLPSLGAGATVLLIAFLILRGRRRRKPQEGT